jgi:hypothetical protein
MDVYLLKLEFSITVRSEEIKRGRYKGNYTLPELDREISINVDLSPLPAPPKPFLYNANAEKLQLHDEGLRKTLAFNLTFQQT